MNKKCTKEEIQMLTKGMDRGWMRIVLITRQMQFQTWDTIEMTKKNVKIGNECWLQCGKSALLQLLLVERALVRPWEKSHLAVSTNVFNASSLWPRNSLHRILWRGMLDHIQEDTHTHTHAVSKRKKEMNWTSLGKWWIQL